MNSIFIDCSNGVSGDMLLAGFLDLGIPKDLIIEPINSIGLESSYLLEVKEHSSGGLRGKKVEVIQKERPLKERRWKYIKELINKATWKETLRSKVLSVFQMLAEVEASVHGCEIENVHFHELGSIDSLVDIIGVCAAIDYLNANTFICSNPPAGSGRVMTSHGYLPVPVPAVVEIARRHQIELVVDELHPKSELTTPTGLALMAVLADKFGFPSSLSISSIGIGIGHKNFDQPNILRVFKLNSNAEEKVNNDPKWEEIILHEAWIDDSSPEDISNFCNELRAAGALEVVHQPVQMKKDRQGILITSISRKDNLVKLRNLWFSLSTTIGLRERIEGRWVLPRRCGFCTTSLGKIRVKQVLRINGEITLKPEHDDLIRLSKESGKGIDEIRSLVYISDSSFLATEDWTC
tara:strand:- start:51 stop:1274 length:1224 start_codon:yes stop_codon:yes gene_type:complete